MAQGCVKKENQKYNQYLQSTKREYLANTLHWEQHSLLFGNSGAFGKYCLSFSQASLETTLRSFSEMHRSPAGRESRKGFDHNMLRDVLQPLIEEITRNKCGEEIHTTSAKTTKVTFNSFL